MADYSKNYCIGGLGGFQGTDGVNPIYLQILVGEGGRQWLEALHVDKELRSMGRLRVIVPHTPDHPDALLDACIAFFPDHFRSCPSLPTVEAKVQDLERLDFDSGDGVPAEWAVLREEAKPRFRELNIWQAELKEMDLSHI